MVSLALPLLLLSWLFIHLIYHFFVPNKSRVVLPTISPHRRRISTTITLKALYLRIESTACNFHHDTLSHWLTRNPTGCLPTTLRAALDLGIVVSLLGMVVALALLSWTFMLLARRLVAGLTPPSPDIHTRVKRALQSDYIPPTFPTLRPDIPVQLLVRPSNICAFMPSYSLPRQYKCRYPESLSRSHISLCSSAHYSSRKSYTKQGTHSLPRCPSYYSSGWSLTDSLPQ